MRQAKLLLSSIIPLVGLAIASPHVVDNDLMQRNAPLQDFGILKNEKGFGSEPVLTDPELAAWAPDSQRQERNNASMEIIQDRSLELTRRQSCNTGYWYCSSFGRCCPQSKLCCSYGYCMDPENTCCPGGSCIPGFTCCNSGTCAPIGGECCLDGNYCEPGNVCVKLFDSGRIVCCTDLKCTAAIVSGTTSYASRTTRVPAQVTPPPRTTDVVENQYETWYYTVTWWYLSFYWTTYQVQSTVTYTTIYSTTTYTTTATDEADASSRFAVLSQGLTFSAPASATSLKSLYDSPATGLEAPTFGTDLDTARVATGTSTRPINTIGRINGPSGDGGASTANALIAGWSFVFCGALSGILMLML